MSNTNFLNFSLYQIQLFLVVCECKSFTTASQIMNTTQSAVSKSIASMERVLGFRHLGITGYNMTHWENGFPQAYIDFLFPWCENPDFYKWLKEHDEGMMICMGKEMPELALSGSMGKDIYKRYRNPIELGWGKTVNYDHDFYCFC